MITALIILSILYGFSVFAWFVFSLQMNIYMDYKITCTVILFLIVGAIFLPFSLFSAAMTFDEYFKKKN